MELKTKKYIAWAITVFIAAVVLTIGVLFLTGAFKTDHDYRTFEGERYSQDLSRLVTSVAGWNNTLIEYTQIYSDGQEIRNTIAEKGVGRLDYEMYNEYHVMGMGDVSEISWYKNAKLVKERVIGGKSSVAVKNVETEVDFALLKQEYSGNYKSYLAAFRADVFSAMQIKKQGGVITYRVNFSDSVTRMIMGDNSTRLQLLLIYENGQVTRLTFMYDKIADKSIADDCNSSVVLTFTNTEKAITWHEEFNTAA